ncbi:crotonyl-CoA carboxylase/reductase [Pendulispora albinea]|uniref:Crotonyl-CoA carboxylase/reductase n=1 Tax=Pendulispora albinea TaxID=2741071 RepID=A0ABZ2M392_9BACT
MSHHPIDHVPIGKLPELGVVPRRMHAWTIRRDRHGVPAKAFEKELVDVPEPGPGEVLVHVMAAGVNYNGIWAASGTPVSVLDIHRNDFHIAGSDASGIVWKTGPGVTRWKVGDEVVLHCNVTCGECAACNGADPMACDEQRIWGYETPYGSFAQFALVQSQQVLPKPEALTWEVAASYGLVCFTAYRMLVHRANVRPGEDVLIWGASGGLGCFAVQITKLLGANAIAVVSSKEKGELAMKMGAAGVIDRNDFPGLAYHPTEGREQAKTRLEMTKRFGRAIWDVLGRKKSPDVVFEHVGQETFPASVFLAGRMGRIVICGATTGYQLTFDVRHLWMRQKMIVGSHFAHAGECEQANTLIHRGKLQPVLTELFDYDSIPEAHQTMIDNRHTGTLACLVGAPRAGLRTLEEVRAATSAEPRYAPAPMPTWAAAQTPYR